MRAESINNSSLIEGLMQTIGSMDSTVRSLRDELAGLRQKDAEHNAERKRLMALIEDKSHQLTNRNRDKFGTKTNREKTNN